MGYELIKLIDTFDGQVTEITLGPPPANILSETAMNEISDAVLNLGKVQNKKLLVFKGEGKHFCFGASVEEHLPKQVGSMLPKFHKFIAGILSCEIPTLARVTGRCLGGGFELALACNFIFAEKAAIFAVPEIQLGVFPPVACVLLPLRGGDAIASQLILTGENSQSQSLFDRGVVNTVTEDGDLDAVLGKFVEKNIVPKSASSLRIANRAARMLTLNKYQEFIGKLESLYLDELMSTNDGVLGITSFLEKKSPQWQNS